jgi:hypothetical protein
MKKVRAIVANPMVSDFLLGFMSSEAIEGMLAMIDDAKQKKRRTGLEKRDSHLKIISEMHQKLGTFS